MVCGVPFVVFLLFSLLFLMDDELSALLSDVLGSTGDVSTAVASLRAANVSSVFDALRAPVDVLQSAGLSALHIAKLRGLLSKEKEKKEKNALVSDGNGVEEVSASAQRVTWLADGGALIWRPEDILKLRANRICGELGKKRRTQKDHVDDDTD